MNTRPLRRWLGRRRSAPLVVVAGLVGALAMSLAMANPLSAYIATVVTTGGTAAAAVVLEETDAGGSVTCRSDSRAPGVPTAPATCAAINSYGGSTTMVPSDARGTTHTSATTVTFRNTGSVAATSFTLGFGACTQGPDAAPGGSATDYCDKLHVQVVSGSTTLVADTTAAAVAGTRVDVGVPAVNGASTVPVTVTTYLDGSADNTHQGLSASQPITWSLAG